MALGTAQAEPAVAHARQIGLADRHAGATVFDLVLPRVAAGVPVSKADLAGMGHGGLCLGCPECHYPACPFGKGV